MVGSASRRDRRAGRRVPVGAGRPPAAVNAGPQERCRTGVDLGCGGGGLMTRGAGSWGSGSAPAPALLDSRGGLVGLDPAAEERAVDARAQAGRRRAVDDTGNRRGAAEPGLARPDRLAGPDAVGPRGDVARVEAGTAVEGVVAATTDEDVVAGAAIENVISGAAGQRVVAGPTVQAVGPVASGQQVAAGAAVDEVVAAGQERQPVAAVDGVPAGAGCDEVVAGAAPDVVVLAVVTDPVAADVPVDEGGAGSAEDDVGAVGAGHLVRAVRDGGGLPEAPGRGRGAGVNAGERSPEEHESQHSGRRFPHGPFLLRRTGGSRWGHPRTRRLKNP